VHAVVVAALVACGGGPIAASPDAGLDAATDAATDVDARPLDASTLGQPCTDSSRCDDGIFCDGVEECLAGVCISARNAACRDASGCATSTCDEGAGGCEVSLGGGSLVCGVGTTCIAGAGCEAVEGCTSDADPKCDDHRDCTDDRCDLTTGACAHLPIDARCPSRVGACGVGACVGRDTDDPSGCGALPDASLCAANEGCTTAFACSALPASCAIDRDCADHSLCDGVERCVSGRCEHGARTRCEARDGCHHAACVTRALGEPFCVDSEVFGCP
jgi:hypothetical protein